MEKVSMETRSLLDDIRGIDKSCLFDLGHPLLNRISESFVKAAGVCFSSLLYSSLHLYYIIHTSIYSIGISESK